MLKLGLKLWSTNTDAYLYEAKRLYAEGVFDYLELFVVPGSIDRLAMWQSFDIPFVIHHAHSATGFNPALKDTFVANEQIAEETRGYVNALNPRCVIFHGGTNGAIEESARQLVYFTRNYFAGQTVVVENKPFKPLPNRMGITECRGSNVAELDFLVDRLKCGVCLDFGHAVASANTQRINPYAFIETLQNRFHPVMYHLSDFVDMASEVDAHPHLGAGNLDIRRIVRTILPSSAMVSIETTKDSRNNLEDFAGDCRFLREISGVP